MQQSVHTGTGTPAQLSFLFGCLAGCAQVRKDAKAAWDTLRGQIEVPDAVAVKDLIAQFTRMAAASNPAGRPKAAHAAGFVAPVVPARGVTGREGYLKR